VTASLLKMAGVDLKWMATT